MIFLKSDVLHGSYYKNILEKIKLKKKAVRVEGRRKEIRIIRAAKKIKGSKASNVSKRNWRN